MNLRTIIISVTLLALAHSAHGEIEIATPLGGYYQPGRYMPVRVRDTGGAVYGDRDVTLRAEGAVPTVIPAAALVGGRTVVVPLLPLTGDAVRLQADGYDRSVPLLRVPAGERLAAVEGGDAAVAFARRLFPGNRVLTVNVMSAGEGSPVAWEAVDAIVFEQMPEPARVMSLLAMGVTVAVRDSGAPPQDRWPWRLESRYWVLRRPWYGPRGAVVPEAYDPPQMWHPGRPIGVRRAAVMGLAVVALLAMGASLALRPRWGMWAVVGVSAIACAGALLWRRELSPVVEANGAVIVTSDGLTQRDDWIYRRHLEPAQGAIASPTADVLLKPALASMGQLERTSLTLHAAAADAEPLQFKYRLEPGWTIAFRTTRLALGRWPGDPVMPVRTPVRELAPLYASQETMVVGQLPDPLPDAPSSSVERWPAVVITQLTSTPTPGTAPATPPR